MKYWTDEDEDTLLRMKAEGKSYDEIGAAVNRTAYAAKQHILAIRRNGGKKPKSTNTWTEEETELLITYSGQRAAPELATMLGRSERSIRSKLHALGISQLRSRRAYRKRWWGLKQEMATTLAAGGFSPTEIIEGLHLDDVPYHVVRDIVDRVNGSGKVDR